MAIYYARANGNVNGVIWATTPTGTASDLFSSFTNADTLMSNNFTVTLNVNTTVLEIRNDTTGGATAGGKFNLSTGVTLTASIVAGGTTCVTAAGTCAIVGSLTATGVGPAVDGSFTSLTITGNIVASSISSVGYGVQFFAGTVNVTGNVTGNNAIGIIGSTGTNINVTGTVTGGSLTNAQGIGGNFTNGTIVGTAIGGSAGAGISHTGTGTCTITRAKGGPLVSSAVGVIGSTVGSTRVAEIEYGDLGASPTSGSIRLNDLITNVAVMYRFGTTKKILIDSDVGGLMPATSNVRAGIVYNGGNSTGTCAVPAASSVAFGVPVDNTTGTAVLTPSNVWDYLTTNINTSNSIGERLKNCSTIASVGQQLSNSLS